MGTPKLHSLPLALLPYFKKSSPQAIVQNVVARPSYFVLLNLQCLASQQLRPPSLESWSTSGRLKISDRALLITCFWWFLLVSDATSADRLYPSNHPKVEFHQCWSWPENAPLGNDVAYPAAWPSEVLCPASPRTRYQQQTYTRRHNRDKEYQWWRGSDRSEWDATTDHYTGSLSPSPASLGVHHCP